MGYDEGTTGAVTTILGSGEWCVKSGGVMSVLVDDDAEATLSTGESVGIEEIDNGLALGRVAVSCPAWPCPCP